MTGRVTYRGKPVIWGGVMFMDGKGQLVQSGMDENGGYTVKNVLAGENQIAVCSPDPRVGESAWVPAKIKKEWFPLPDKWEDPRKSGLRYNVQPGTTSTYNIELP